ncbi:MAG: DUF1573 domain-containing protein [Verrucomicrobiota bacterium]|nr:DUF1573 domain-containing protein [Verrucomicrobiota bacterium]
MKSARFFLLDRLQVAWLLSSLLAVTAVSAQAAAPVGSRPIYVPNTSQAKAPMQGNTLVWNTLTETTNIFDNVPAAHFLFTFTNVSSDRVSILDVQPSCGCTTAQLPPLPWTIPAGGAGKIPVTVNVAAKFGTLFKSLTVSTDKGQKVLWMRITINPAPLPKMNAADRARFDQMAKADRQAVFKGNCVTCHVQRGEGKYGEALYDADCAICHEGPDRATMVPSLHDLKVASNFDFWRMWISQGKPGTLMPAFAGADGGPLNDLQINTLARYLVQTIPSKVPPRH